MDNSFILKTAMEGSADDVGCSAEDFLKSKNLVFPFRLSPRSKSYYKDDIACNFISYGSNIVAASKSEYADIAAEYMNRFEYYHCFETPNLNWLSEALAPFGQKVCFMAEYFLPDMRAFEVLPCGYEIRILEPEDFSGLYLPEWGNALCEKRKTLDVLCVGAYDGSKLIGLAGCSADCAEMRQIGIDVLPEYRRRGLASALTSRLASEIMNRGKVPYYCAAWSNIPSVRNALRSGLRPAWVEMTVKPAAVVDEMNT